MRIRVLSKIVVTAALAATLVAAPAADAETATTACAKQAKAATSAKKAVTKAQRAKASTPAAKKQRAKRVKAAKAKHAKAREALTACKAKPAPAPPAPAPVAEPAPVAPVMSLAANTIFAGDAWTVTVAAPPPPAGFVYRLAFLSRTGSSTCSFLVIKNNVSHAGQTVLQSPRPWCPGAGRISLHQAVEGSPLPRLGALAGAIDVAVVAQ